MAAIELAPQPPRTPVTATTRPAQRSGGRGRTAEDEAAEMADDQIAGQRFRQIIRRPQAARDLPVEFQPVQLADHQHAHVGLDHVGEGPRGPSARAPHRRRRPREYAARWSSASPRRAARMPPRRRSGGSGSISDSDARQHPFGFRIGNKRDQMTPIVPKCARAGLRRGLGQTGGISTAAFPTRYDPNSATSCRDLTPGAGSPRPRRRCPLVPGHGHARGRRDWPPSRRCSHRSCRRTAARSILPLHQSYARTRPASSPSQAAEAA